MSRRLEGTAFSDGLAISITEKQTPWEPCSICSQVEASASLAIAVSYCTLRVLVVEFKRIQHDFINGGCKNQLLQLGKAFHERGSVMLDEVASEALRCAARWAPHFVLERMDAGSQKCHILLSE